MNRDKMPFRCYQHTPAMEAAWQGLVPEDLERRLHKFTMDLEAETVRLTRKTEDCGRGPTPTPSEVRGGGGAFPASPQGAPFCRGLVYGERDTVRTAERWTRTSVKWAVPFKHPSFSELRGSDCGLVQVVCPPPQKRRHVRLSPAVTMLGVCGLSCCVDSPQAGEIIVLMPTNHSANTPTLVKQDRLAATCRMMFP